ncbi:MAG: dimethyl sulfoxide reductase anchor subunit [Acidobacteria bacterium]|nr:dimethyl sulfoxide reductase anchor subunit [Acidobacteriota bacterium]
MTKCIGCRCCEVACNEQNGNPAHVQWRRVGEIEGGWYPHTQRLYLSMGCNHCVEPSCLLGCPVDAFRKDASTGLVLHSAEACIGCQYCIWNCPYGVPQYNEERGVVGKCDMCYGRLEEQQIPACANACPQQAIEIETVNIAEWILAYGAADSPGLPPAEHTISTTRITLPEDMPPSPQRADSTRVRPENPHTPLILMLVLTQLSVGAFVALWLAGTAGGVAKLASLLVGLLSLGASTLHLGRPVYAWRALKMWRRSWLSREVLLLSAFAGAAGAYAFFGSAIVGALTALLGIAGVTASSQIYRVPARPAWNSLFTPAEFCLTGGLLGPLFVAALAGANSFLMAASVAAAGLQILTTGLKLLWLIGSDEFELRASARLLSGELERWLLLRLALLVLGGIVFPLSHLPFPALLAALASELLGRYLFFVSVVPKKAAAGFFAGEAA